MEFLMNYIMYYFNMVVRILLMIAFSLITGIISERIKRVYHDFSSGNLESGATGCDTAKKLLHENDIRDIGVTRKYSLLNDGYSRTKKNITLGKKIYSKSSITACAVAAKKTSPAIVFSMKFSLFSLLYLLRPVVRVITLFYFPLLLLSIFESIVFKTNYVYYIFVLFLALQLITLPVEISSNRIALWELKNTGLLTEEELYGAKKVVRSMSLTYISTIIITLIYVVRF